VPVRADAVSAYIKALDEALADRLDGYRAHLAAAPLAAHTRRTYTGRVAGYRSWLAEHDPLTRRRQGDPFIDGRARDYTVRDYRTHLLSAGRAKPASVNLTLAAVDHFYRFTGLGPANTRREQLPQAAPRGRWTPTRPAGCCAPPNAPPPTPAGSGAGRSPACCCSPGCGSPGSSRSTAMQEAPPDWPTQVCEAVAQLWESFCCCWSRRSSDRPGPAPPAPFV